jgi:hypothetical protein
MHTTHGMNRTPEHRAWAAMKNRCDNPRNAGWKNYGGRGIKVCEEWRAFEAFFRDMGPRPPGTELDRINVNGNYEPGNCRWTDELTQQNNRRKHHRIAGRNASQHARALGLTNDAIYRRIKRGWSPIKAATEPRRPGGRVKNN